LPDGAPQRTPAPPARPSRLPTPSSSLRCPAAREVVEGVKESRRKGVRRAAVEKLAEVRFKLAYQPLVPLLPSHLAASSPPTPPPPSTSSTPPLGRRRCGPWWRRGCRGARSYKSGRTGAARPGTGHLARHISNLLGKSFQQKKRDLNYLQWLQSY